MSGSRFQKPVEPERDEDADAPRTTVRPAFDVERYAADVVHRDRLPTILDADATEEARIASVLMDSMPPMRAGAPIADAEVAIDVEYETVESLDPEEQLAFLRARLAPLSRVPALTRKLTDLGPVISDPKMAYVLGLVDGVLPMETIVEVAGLPELDTLKILDRAIVEYAISFGKAAR